MKNPFTTPMTEKYLRIEGFSDEEAEYAAHAINQHEKLVELLKVCNAALKAGVPASLRRKIRVEIATLLKAEKT